MTDQEAAREIKFLAKLNHPNRVPLLGYCLAGEQGIAIYDCMENQNLHNFLYELPLSLQTTTKDWALETWEDKHDMINIGPEGPHSALGDSGTTRVLAFLHHYCSQPILNGDLKAGEIARGSHGCTILPEFHRHQESCSTTNCDGYGFVVTDDRTVEALKIDYLCKAEIPLWLPNMQQIA